MHTWAASAASSPSGIATIAVRGVISSLTGRSANASTPDTTAISSAEASASVSALESTAASAVRFDGSRHATNGASSVPSCCSRGTACATIGSPQRPLPPPPTWPRAAARRRGPARGASPLPLNHDAGDAAPVDPLDHDLVSVEGELVAGAGHPSQDEVHQAAHGGDLGMLERAPERLRQVVQRDAPVHPVAVSALPDGGGLPHVVLVVNLAD